MPKYSFLVREEVQRDRIYKIDAKDEKEARYLLDGFKQEPTQHTPATESLTVQDYHIRECYRSNPEEGEPVVYRGEITKLKVIRGNWTIITENHSLSVRTNELEWDEENGRWFILNSN